MATIARAVLADAILTLRSRPIFALLSFLAAGLVGALIFVGVAYHVSFSPLKLTSRELSVGAAKTSFIVDRRTSSFADGRSNVQALISRSGVYADLMTSDEILDDVAGTADVPRRQLTAQGPPSKLGPNGVRNAEDESLAQQRANELVAESVPYRLAYDVQEQSPVVQVFAQAPTAAQAAALADASVLALRRYLRSERRSGDFKRRNAVRIRQLGEPTAGTVGVGNRMALAAIAALVGFFATLALILAVARTARDVRVASVERRLERRSAAGALETADLRRSGGRADRALARGDG